MPLVQTRGAASAQGFGEFAVVAPAIPYIEDVFSCFLYTGTGASNAITNNIDLSTKGGLVWIKQRNTAIEHFLYDTARGVTKSLSSNDTTSEYTNVDTLTAFGTSGFTLGSSNFVNGITSAPRNYVSWTFREQPKFFDVVTYTGTGANRTIAHNLGSVPGSIIVKRTDTTADWAVYHRSLANTQYLVLNTSAAAATGATWWNSTTPTSSVFSLGTNSTVNASGGTYVAYIFAHDAGGFGLLGTDNVISCGIMTADGSGNFSATVGFEPQWVLVKGGSSTSRWDIFDNMRGVTASSGYTSAQRLNANLTDAEDEMSDPYGLGVSATGFTGNIAQAFNNTLIYIAIRRGPMAVPTVGTSVFSPIARTGTGSQTNVGGLSFSPDLLLVKNRGNTQLNWAFDRLRGDNEPLSSNSTDDEATNTATYFGGPTVFTPNNTGFGISSAAQVNTTSGSYANWLFGRAPSVFDVCCYTGNGSTQNVSHNLGVVPELIIAKSRSLSGSDWWVYASPLTTPQNKYLQLQSTGGESTVTGLWGSSLPTSTTFGLGAFAPNSSGATFVAYLFATCAGVSKVGSYTGNAGYTVTVPCGFTAGVRFVLIKRTDSTGDWYVWDSARGIIAGDDPYLLLNSTAAEVTNTDYVDTYAAGFEVTSTAPAGLNATGGTYIFLAIA